MDVIRIGRCMGCDGMSRLDEGVCAKCLNDPKRGRKWAEQAHRCRTDPDFALSVYSRIRSESGRRMFEAAFGKPGGA